MRVHSVCLARMLCALLLAVAAAGCAVPVSYYDATTYTHLTSLKAEATSLIETFDAKPYAKNEDRIETVTLGLRKAYEYEKGKGEPNSDTAKQFELIGKLYAETIAEYRESKPRELGRKYFQQAAVVLGQAFDIAIRSENLKNKDKR